MKQILYIGRYNGVIGGIERYMMQSARLLRTNGFSVHYLYTETGGRDQENFAAAFDSAAPFTPGSGLISATDMIIIHNIIAPELLKTLPEKKTLFFAHDHNIYCQRHHYYTPPFRINCHRRYNKFFCTLCSLGRNTPPPLAEYRKLPALVLSEFMAANLRKNGFEKVFKLPAFIATGEAQKRFMPAKVLRILFLGQLIRGKGADLMLKTLVKLDIPFECTIAGDGNDRRMLEAMVRGYRLQEKVRFAGFVSEPEKLWQNCDIFFFPIRWQEPFGLVALEAMAHGVPVAAFDLGGVGEYLDETCGSLIPEKDLSGAANALKQLYLQPEKLPLLGANARKIAAEKFSEANFIEKFTQLCEELL